MPSMLQSRVTAAITALEKILVDADALDQEAAAREAKLVEVTARLHEKTLAAKPRLLEEIRELERKTELKRSEPWRRRW